MLEIIIAVITVVATLSCLVVLWSIKDTVERMEIRLWGIERKVQFMDNQLCLMRYHVDNTDICVQDIHKKLSKKEKKNEKRKTKEDC